MLVRMWRNWNPCALLVEVQNATEMDNNIMIPQKLNSGIPFDPAIPLVVDTQNS